MSSRTTSAPAATIAVTAAVVVAVVALVVTVVVRARGGPSPSPVPEEPPRMPAVSVTEAVESLAVLRDWDRARAAAWAAGDLAALGRLYAPGSQAGRRDLGMLRDWLGRGLHVRRMAMQVLAVELRARTDRRIVLLVTDRLADAVAVPAGGGPRRTLPRDGVTTRRLEFRRTAGHWVLASARARPLAATEVTVGS